MALGGIEPGSFGRQRDTDKGFGAYRGPGFDETIIGSVEEWWRVASVDGRANIGNLQGGNVVYFSSIFMMAGCTG